jgi:hypothetical protein
MNGHIRETRAREDSRQPRCRRLASKVTAGTQEKPGDAAQAAVDLAIPLRSS